MYKRRGYKRKQTIGSKLLVCENKGKYSLPFEAKLAWLLLIALALAKYFHAI